MSSQTLIYDEACPLCRKYTSFFDNRGMAGREGYTLVNNHSCVDVDRARNEIALVRGSEVLYGVDSLIAVIETKYRRAAFLIKQPIIKAILNVLYGLISYNRKVIMPGPSNDPCVPDFHLGYRLGYLATSMLATVFILQYATAGTLDAYSILYVTVVLLTQLLFQGLLVFILNRAVVMTYLGRLTTTTMVFAIAVLPMKWLPAGMDMAWLCLMVLVDFWLHYRSVRRLELPSIICLGWAVYRFVLLSQILH